jgi:uncharacterized protein
MKRRKKRKSKKNKKIAIILKLIAGFLGLAAVILIFAFVLVYIEEQEGSNGKTDNSVGSSNIQQHHRQTEADKKISGSKETYTQEKPKDQLVAKNYLPQAHTERPEILNGSISVVIDDVGNSIEELMPFLTLPGNISFAVLPDLPYSKETSRLIHEAGKDILLHLPMEAVNGNNPGPGAISVSDDADKIAATINEDLKTVPGAIGINNHMGSKATADAGTMSSVFSALQGKGLFFLDSRTTAESKAADVGPIFGIKVVQRNIFLDNDTTPEAVKEQLERGLLIAKETGSCIFIGHVQNKVVYNVLSELLPQIEKKSYKLITLKKLAGVAKT